MRERERGRRKRGIVKGFRGLNGSGRIKGLIIIAISFVTCDFVTSRRAND